MMKKLCIVIWLFSLFAPKVVFADAGRELQNRLNKVNSFYAEFSQTVISADNTQVQQGQGQLWVKRPNLFNWHMTSPDESVLISDGNTLWYYSPFVEQVTASWLKNTATNTPFMLITRNHSEDWKQYNFSQQGNDFSLTPKLTESYLRQFKITVTPEGVISSFTVVEQDGQRSVYQLKGQKNGPVDATKFTFTPPKGVTLDDQRQ